MAVEQGVGRFAKDIYVVINPRVKMAAKKWLLNKYNTISVRDGFIYQILILPEVIKEPTKYQEQLKAFLALTVTAPEAKKVKKFTKQYKSYAEALGLSQKSKPEKKKETTKLLQNKKRPYEAAGKDEELIGIIKNIAKQMQTLTKLVIKLYDKQNLPSSSEKK